MTFYQASVGIKTNTSPCYNSTEIGTSTATGPISSYAS